ncbi:DUF1310 family protein [Enterococcus sp. DIV0242_7C1]|uniref:DUF1310 family protein n=1 Tax=Candidatus Enterococcus dunnyi TaxID=1834192 RepID=A0A200J0A8_9ENTE|nr:MULTISPECIES: DUF1310 family protein [unclassified Enterococcus]MBO0470162.1 DUF1310 family protein [Enterococcus sp. DIV0242_7C1]OUZ30618.1 hypothetical protein A5889_002906 [Enterococcus sp. 9D6_DIV0238]
MKRNLIVVTGIIILIILFIGGKMYMNSKKLDEEMIEIVYSDEAKKVFEDGLKDLDQNALTDEGIIKTYEIDKESVRRNPMGGINGSIYVNRDKSLEILFNLDKKNENEFKKNVVSGYSNNLKLLLKGEK